jgi:hypothetical protein
MRKLTVVLALLATLVGGLAVTAWAQVTPEIRPYVGAFFPTGDERDLLKDAFLVGGQVGVEIAEQIHLIGTFGYVPNKDRALFPQPDVGIFQYDVGVEAFRIVSTESSWELRPFIGLGGGARTYDPSPGGTETNLAGYGALGMEFQNGTLALRLEGRDYLTRFKGLTGNQDAKTRNDIMTMVGVALHW